MTSGKTNLKPLRAGLCLMLAATVWFSAPAIGAQKIGAQKKAATKATAATDKKATKSLPLQTLDTSAPPSVNATPDSRLITPVSALEKSGDKQASSPIVAKPAPEPVADTGETEQDSMTSVTDLQERHIQPVSFNKAKAKNLKPTSYSTIGAIAIFPVIKHGRDKAFGDVPLMVAREFALKMEQKAPETRVLNPIYTVEEIRMRGLGHVYDKLMDYYIQTGRPEPLALDYLLGQLSADGRSVTRVMFVEADMDMGHPDAPTTLMDRFKGYMTDAIPKYMQYYVEGRLQVFDSGEPDCPMVWSFNRTKSLKINEVLNVTPSVYQDSDSQHAFAKLSRELSWDLLFIMPKVAYMQPEYDTSVHGQVVGTSQDTPKNAGPAPLSEKTRDAIERILGQ